jgi:hypothetical protein
MASNDNGNYKLLEEAESSTARKRLWLSNDDVSNDDAGDSPEEEMEEVSSEETSMKHLDTSEEKLFAKRGGSMIFNDDGDITSPSLEPRAPECRPRSNEDISDEDDDDDDFRM